MARLMLDITMSLDGFIAGPNQSLEQPLGEGGERLHEWMVKLASFRERHGLSGGESNSDTEILEESIRATGAVVMGRRMFSGGAGPWEDDPNAGGWGGDDPPFHVPGVVLSHHARGPVVRDGATTVTFGTDANQTHLGTARGAPGAHDTRP